MNGLQFNYMISEIILYDFKKNEIRLKINYIRGIISLQN